jgi:hypothetical protein
MPVISRIGYYLTVTQILLVPDIIMEIKDYKQKRLVKAAAAGAAVVFFLIFMFRQAAADGVRILPYQTWLFHDMVPIEYQILD